MSSYKHDDVAFSIRVPAGELAEFDSFCSESMMSRAAMLRSLIRGIPRFVADVSAIADRCVKVGSVSPLQSGWIAAGIRVHPTDSMFDAQLLPAPAAKDAGPSAKDLPGQKRFA